MQTWYQIHISAVFFIVAMLAWEQFRMILPGGNTNTNGQTLSATALCYGYSPQVHVVSGVFLFLLGLGSMYWFLFGMQAAVGIILAGLVVSGFSLWAIPVLLGMQARIYFMKDGLFIQYFDKRSQWIGWGELSDIVYKNTILGRLWYCQRVQGSTSFLCHNVLMESEELVRFVKDRIKEFDQKIQKPSD